MKKLWLKFKLYLSANLAAEQERMIAWLPFLAAVGIALYFALPFEPNIWLTLGVFELWLLIFYLCRYKNLHLFFIAGIFIFGGFLNIQAHTLYHAKRLETFSAPTPTYLQGQIKDISVSQKGKTRLLLHNAADFAKPLKGDFRITVMPAPQDLAVGKCIETVATLFPREPLPVLNGYRLDRKNFYENLSAIGYTNSETFIIDCPSQRQKITFHHRLNALRQNIMSYIDKTLPEYESGVTDAVLLGEKTHIPTAITDNYRNSGLAHFLSVSGLHMGTIAGLIFFVIRFLLALFPWVALRFDIKKVAAVASLFFSAFYLLISGMAIPAIRAYIMTAVVLIGVIFNRQAISLRMVTFAALAVLLVAPQALVSVSFQMSFAAVYALVSFYESYKRKPYRKRGVFGTVWLYLSGIVICDFIASLATAPFSLYHFQRLALYTSLGNLLAGPLIGLYIMPILLLCLATLPFHLAFYPLKLLGFGINILNRITDFVAHLPHSVWQTDALSLWCLILIVIGGFWLCVWQQKWRRLGIIPIVIGVLPLFWPSAKPDMVFSPYGADIALRDNAGDLVMLPRQNDSWVKNLWIENLELKPLSRCEQRNLSISELKCAENACVYKNAITFDQTGNIKLNNRQIDNSAGGYIYLTPEPHWKPLWNKSQQRPWNNFFQSIKE